MQIEKQGATGKRRVRKIKEVYERILDPSLVYIWVIDQCDPLRGSQLGGFQATPVHLALEATYHRFVYACCALGFESEFVGEDCI